MRWIQAGLSAVEPAARVAHALRGQSVEKCALLAVGKAAGGMASGAESALKGRVASALVIGSGPLRHPLPDKWRYMTGDHPVPGKNSLAAGRAARRFVENLEPGAPLIVLLSGGGSALMEIPVPGLLLPELQAINRCLLASGMDIGRMNDIRARFSMLKRGGLLRLAGERRVTGLIMSDVPQDRVADIASGPLSPEPFCWPAEKLPQALQDWHERLPMPPSDPPLAIPDIEIIGRNADALAAIAQQVEDDGFAVAERRSLSGDAVEAGTGIAARLRNGPPGVYLHGGETTVRLPDSHGRGGRNQQLALAAANTLAGSNDVLLLAFATDGIDGNTEDAGALVDGGTVDRIREAGLEARACLAAADSNAALAAAGDIIHTGPTGTNVMDIVIGWKFA
ncbi:MAG TPA: DUF4147 domain-containing protein [Gammaproteobacteria bacterium]